MGAGRDCCFWWSEGSRDHIWRIRRFSTAVDTLAPSEGLTSACLDIGGISVFNQVASPLSAGLFKGAISQSGYPTAVTAASSAACLVSCVAQVSGEFGLARTARWAAGARHTGGARARRRVALAAHVFACVGHIRIV